MFCVSEKIKEIVSKYLGDFKLTPALAAENNLNSTVALGCNRGCEGGCYGCAGGCQGFQGD